MVLETISLTDRPSWVSNNGLRVTSRTDKSIDLEWQNNLSVNSLADMGEAKYTLQMKSSGSEEFETVFKGYAHGTQVVNLRPNSSYAFRLMADTGGNDHQWGSVINGATDVEKPTADDLFRAIHHNALEMVQKILTASTTHHYLRLLMTTHDNMNRTPLMVAASNKNLEIMIQLINNGAEADLQARRTGKSALMVASYDGSYACLKYLHNLGANWSLKDARGLNALHYVIEGAAYNNVSPAIVKYVAERMPVDGINEKDIFGWTPLMRAVNLNGTPLEAIKVLVGFKADVNATDKENKRSILMAAILKGKEDIVQFLLLSKADPNYVNRNGESCLEFAMKLQRLSILSLLKKVLDNPEEGGFGSMLN